MSAIILQGDALNLPLPDESVDLIVTSPPYFALRSYQDSGAHYDGQIGSEPTPQDFLEALWKATAEMKRVLKPSGSIFVNLGDKYAGGGGQWDKDERPDPGRRRAVSGKVSTGGKTFGYRAKSLMGLPWRYAIGCIDELDLILRAEIVWSKPNGLPESVVDRVRRSHEQWFHFTKELRYFSGVDEIREPHAPGTAARYAAGYKSNARTENGQQSTPSIPLGVENLEPNPLGKLPGSVWTIPTEPLKVPAHLGIDHFAAFPTEWPRRFILGWSPSGVCVECDEGRRPLAEKSESIKTGGGVNQEKNNHPLRHTPGFEDYVGKATTLGFTSKFSITGYACACPEPTADTTPAVVLDPFGGTGTTALVAHTLGRIGISVDLSHDYTRLARWRCNESGHGKKALGRTWAERQGGLAV